MSRTKSPAKSRSRKTSNPERESRTTNVLSGNRLIAVLCGLLAAATIAVYSPVLGHRFVIWDDREYVTGNPHLATGLSWSTIKWAFSATYAANWHPLTWLSHALDYQLFGLNPAGHHMHSVLLHAVNVVLLFLLLLWMTRRTGPSLLVAALFALHPLNVESVAWVAERKNVLSTLFFLLAIGSYVWYAQRPNWRRYLLLTALFAAGLMAKPMLVTLPLLLLLLDYWPLERFAGSPPGTAGAQQATALRLVLEKAPLLVLSAASSWITVIAQRSAYSVRNLQEFPLAYRIENVPVAYARYLWKMVWPAGLAALYPNRANGLPLWQVLLSTVVLVAITLLVIVFRRKRYLPVGWFWFLGTLVPVIGLVQVGEAGMADRYAYLSLIGIFLMIGFGLDDWAQAKSVPTRWRVVPAVCVLAVLSVVTVRQIGAWESEFSLWSHTVAVTEQNPFAHAALSVALLNPDLGMSTEDMQALDTPEKRVDEARRHYEEALALYRQLVQQSPDTYMPDMATTLSSLGYVARLQNQPDKAREYYEESLQYYQQLELKNPQPHLANIAAALRNLAAVERGEGQGNPALQHDQKALVVYRQLAQKDPGMYEPKIVDALIDLGYTEKSLGQPNQASAYFEEALTIGRQLAQQDPAIYLPSLASRLTNLGNFDKEQNRMTEARQHYEEAVKIYGQLAQQNQTAYLAGMATTLNDLANLDLAEHRQDGARQHFEQALEVDHRLAQQDPGQYLPDLAWQLNNLERMDGAANRMDSARQRFQEALKAYRQLAQQDPGRYLPALADSLNNLGLLARIEKQTGESRAYYSEALSIYQRLAQANPGQFANDMARVEASLAALGAATSSH